MKKSVLVQILAAIAGPSLLVGAVYFATNNLLVRKAKASAYVAHFDDRNSPTLSGGAATVTDSRGIVWEYSGATDYANGHITLGHGGYFGIKSTSPYGLKGIEYITVDYAEDENAELWLLKSVDGLDWNESRILEDDTPTDYANNWQYIRFYNYATDLTTSIDIDSVEIGYSCTTSGSASEDTDFTSCYKTLTTDGTTGTISTATKSPRSNSSQALSFSKTGSGNTYADFELDRIYTLGEVASSKVSFDLYRSANVWKPSVSLFSGSTIVGAEIRNSSNSYFFYEIDDDWWRIEVLINSVAATVCDPARGDTPADITKQIDKIRIGIGNGIIDNLRFDSTISRTDEFGLFNKGYSFNIGKTYWVKISWAGSIHGCTFTYGTPGVAQSYPSDKSPLYIVGLATGTTTLTPTFILGYNRQTVTMTHSISTVTVN